MITLDWANEAHTIIYYTVTGRWTWDELQAVIKHAHAMIDGANRPVDSIVDLRKGLGLPAGPMWYVQRMAAGRHPNSGRMILLGAPQVIKVLFDTIRRVNPRTVKRIRFASSPEEAYTLLAVAEPVGTSRGPALALPTAKIDGSPVYRE
jgi:hypothetical protein